MRNGGSTTWSCDFLLSLPSTKNHMIMFKFEFRNLNPILLLSLSNLGLDFASPILSWSWTRLCIVQHYISPRDVDNVSWAIGKHYFSYYYFFLNFLLTRKNPPRHHHNDYHPPWPHNDNYYQNHGNTQGSWHGDKSDDQGRVWHGSHHGWLFITPHLSPATLYLSQVTCVKVQVKTMGMP